MNSITLYYRGIHECKCHLSLCNSTNINSFYALKITRIGYNHPDNWKYNAEITTKIHSLFTAINELPWL